MTQLANILLAAAVVLILLPGTPPAFSQPSWNPTASDVSLNTAGGDRALSALPVMGRGERNTAFGFEALYRNTSGNHNTAIGRGCPDRC